MQNSMDQKELEKKLKQLQTDYKTVFNTDEGKESWLILKKDVILLLPPISKVIVMKVHIWKDNAAFFYL